jgi:hypothetical protein
MNTFTAQDMKDHSRCWKEKDIVSLIWEHSGIVHHKPPLGEDASPKDRVKRGLSSACVEEELACTKREHSDMNTFTAPELALLTEKQKPTIKLLKELQEGLVALNKAWDEEIQNALSAGKLKPAKKVIDLAALVDGIDCEFSGTPDFKELYISKMIKADWRTLVDYNSCHNNMYRGTSYCRPRMNHKHAWDGGECAIKGFVVRAWLDKEDFVTIHTSDSIIDWNDVVYVEFLEVEHGYVMPWEGDV